MTIHRPAHLLARLLIVVFVAAGLVPQAPRAALAHSSAVAAPQAALAHPPAPEVVQAPTSPAAQASPVAPEWVVRTLPTGVLTTTSVALGDLNGDGVLDLVQGNEGAASKVLLGRGDGTFTITAELSWGDNLTAKVALGDLDGDGVLDIVRASKGETNLVMLGEGDGTFAAPIELPGGKAAGFINDVALGDLDRDGDLDLVIFGEFGEIWLGDGHGHFTRIEDLPSEIKYFSSGDVGDLNGDGIFDVVAFGEWRVQNNHLGEIFVGKGDGMFEKDLMSSLNTGMVVDMDMGDLNGDGDIDIVLGISDYMGFDFIEVLLGEGNGRFVKRIELPGEISDLDSIMLGDINGDGALDMVLGNGYEVLLGHGDGTFVQRVALPSRGDSIKSVALGDLNRDGVLDIVQGNSGNSSIVLLGRSDWIVGATIPLPGDTHATSVAPGDTYVTSTALGDVNSDGVLDIVQGNYNKSSTLFLGQGDGHFADPVELPGDARSTLSIALGDVDSDGDLDIIQSGFEVSSTVLLRQPDGTFAEPSAPLAGAIQTQGVVLGDLDNDGILDLIQSGYQMTGTVQLGIGDGTFTEPVALPSGERYTEGIALGDLNNDGNLDLVQGNYRQPSEMLLGRGDGTFSETITLIGDEYTIANSIAIGDLNNDGELDLVQGNDRSPSFVLMGHGDGSFGDPIDLPSGTHFISSLALGDLNGDGVLDIVQMNGLEPGEVLLGRGDGTFSPSVALSSGNTSSVMVGDLNSDGVLDIVRDNDSEVLLGRRNSHFAPLPPARSDWSGCLPGASLAAGSPSLPKVYVSQPPGSPSTPLLAGPTIYAGPVIHIPYILTTREPDLVGQVQGFYSLDGGGFWQPATPTRATRICGLEATPAGSAHVFAWDTVADGVTGRYDQVQFRIEAAPYIRHTRGHAVELPRFASSSGVSSPFRLRGIQARVVDVGGRGMDNMRVYRLEKNGDPRDGQLTPPPMPGNPQWFTDWQGYLKGHGVLTPTDRLVALAPISSTDTYTLFLTSARPTPQGLDLYEVRSSGVQTLTVRPEQPLILFNLDLSLEWDARSDAAFRGQLEANLKRASELLFRWSGGQVALGDLRVFNSGEHWNDAEIRIYATNRLRPNAAQGGIVTRPLSDTLRPEVAYTPGQVRIGAVWNRYGDSAANLGEDWARTLAHELGHYALFLNDNYLGKDAQGRLIGLSGCRGPMTDPYRDDYGMFHPSGPEWERDCRDTLSQAENGRSDWATIKSFYDQTGLNFALNMPQTFDASATPELLPLAVTRVRFALADAPVAKQPLSAPIVLLTGADGRALKPGLQTWARAALYQDGRLIDLGAPSEDQLLARGARPGDRVCVYDFAQTTRVGCTQISANYQKLQLTEVSDWRPDIRITAATSQSLLVRVENVPAGLQLNAQFYPADYAALASVPFARDGQGYTVTISAPEGAGEAPMLEGALRIWADGPTAREVVVDVRAGAKGSKVWGSGVPSRNCPTCTTKKKRAPVLSGDGQAILSTEAVTLTEGAFYALQAVDSPPEAPTWATPVGRAYRLNASAGLNWAGSSLSLSYFGGDVELAQEDGIRVFFRDDQTRTWRALDTALDADHNQASALVQGPGLYMLMASARVPLSASGWNLVFFYPGVKQAVKEAAATIAGEFTSIYGYDPQRPADPWRIYDRTVPSAWAATVNDLAEVAYGEGYWIYATRPVSWFVRPGPEAPSTQARPLTMPPATYYGPAPRAGLTVEALVGGAVCGRAQTAEADIGGARRAVFVVKVRAAGDGGALCGLPGRTITLVFRDGPAEVRRIVTDWDNRQANQLPRSTYLPQVRR